MVHAYFRKKDRGQKKSNSCCQKVLPLIDSVMIEKPWLTLMQDNSPSHGSTKTIGEVS